MGRGTCRTTPSDYMSRCRPSVPIFPACATESLRWVTGHTPRPFATAGGASIASCPNSERGGSGRSSCTTPARVRCRRKWQASGSAVGLRCAASDSARSLLSPCDRGIGRAGEKRVFFTLTPALSRRGREGFWSSLAALLAFHHRYRLDLEQQIVLDESIDADHSRGGRVRLGNVAASHP